MNIDYKKEFIEYSEKYRNFCEKINLKNRYKTELSNQEKKELNKLNNLRLKYEKLYFSKITLK